MAIQFEFYKNPQPEKEGEEPSYHSFRSMSSSEREVECGLYFERRRCVVIHKLFKSLSAWKLMDFSFLCCRDGIL